MDLAREILSQTWRNLWAHKLRSTLTMFGISWGIASIIFMIAIGEGCKVGYKNMMYTLGTDIVILWGGRTSQQAGGQRAGKNIRFTYEDVLAIQKECYLVKHVTPELANSRLAKSAHNAGTFSVHGVAPVYQEIRSMKLAQGRHINQQDFDEERPVCLLGSEVKEQLFKDRPAIGAQIHIGNVPFTVIGELAKKDQNNSYNGMDESKIVIPYPTMARHFPDGRPFIGANALNNIIFMPVSADQHDAALKQVKALLGRLHGFNPSDEGAIWSWDTVQSAQMVSKIYDSMQIFLSFMAAITLGLGGIGVMNITLISVAERTREIGVKKAIGAKPRRIMAEFFVEALSLTMLSGLVGLALALALCHLVNRLPLPTLFAGLPVTPGAAAIAMGTLILVGILSAIYPARRAARLQPVEALRHE